MTALPTGPGRQQGTFPRLLLLTIVASLVGPLDRAPNPAAQVASTGYTFTQIAAHRFLQFVEGSGVDPVPQRIDEVSLSINDDGVVAFGHAVDIAALARSVVSAGDGGIPVQIYGGGVLSPGTGRTGIDGDGGVYLVDNITPNNIDITGPVCGVGVFGLCLFDSRLTVGLPMTHPGFWVVNGIHPRLRPATAPGRVAYLFDTATGTEVRSEASGTGSIAIRVTGRSPT